MTALRFAHVYIVAREWRRLARFYLEVFDCQAVPPERNLSGERIDAATGLRTVTTPIEGAGTITFAYARDPEGNIIELQARTPEKEK